MDEEIQARIRRYKRNIEMSGAAMIVYGLWTVVKFFFPILIGSAKLADLLEIEPEEAAQYGWLLFLLTFFIVSLSFVAHYLLGRAAIRFARGTKKSIVFAYVAILFLILNIMTVLNYPETIKNMKSVSEADTMFATFMVDMTLLFILFDMIISTFKLVKLRKGEETGQ